MIYRLQKNVFMLLGLILVMSGPVFAMETDIDGKKATVEQLESEVQARQSADDALQLQIDNFPIIQGEKGDKGDPGANTPDRTKELCALYLHLDNMSLLGSLTVPEYCPKPMYCTSDVKQCADGSYVSRDPYNNCEFFACPQEPQFCGGIAGIQCTDSLVCVDDPSDSCDPIKGGADCGGICVTPTK